MEPSHLFIIVVAISSVLVSVSLLFFHLLYYIGARLFLNHELISANIGTICNLIKSKNNFRNKLTIQIPSSDSKYMLYSRTVFAMKLSVQIPRFMPVCVLNRRTTFTVEITV